MAFGSNSTLRNATDLVDPSKVRDFVQGNTFGICLYSIMMTAILYDGCECPTYHNCHFPALIFSTVHTLEKEV
jgi:hypothetical protein